MKNMKKIIIVTMVAVLVLSSCSSKSKNSKKELTFWSAPNADQLSFWSSLAKEYNDTNPEYKIIIQQMPETPSSEAGIQNAIASGEAPIASDNIQLGFATQLATNQAIIPLQDLEGYKSIIKTRKMENTVKGWELNKNQYVIPFYSNPVLTAWRVDALKDLGINEMPKSYDDYYKLADAIKAAGVDKYALGDEKIQKPADWWERWYDFFNYYYAQSNGQAFIENEKLVADETAVLDVLTFLDTLAAKEKGMLTSPSDTSFGDALAISVAIGPWLLPDIEKKYPTLKSPENFDIQMPPTKDGKATKTFADSKGIVFYAGSSDEEITGMMDFLNFAMTDETDLKFLEKTKLLPARDDLGTNEIFSKFFEQNLALKTYANAVGGGVPPMSSSKMQEIQEVMGKHIQEMVNTNITPQDTWKNMKNDITTLLK